jgi:hypothetical protein
MSAAEADALRALVSATVWSSKRQRVGGDVNPRDFGVRRGFA